MNRLALALLLLPLSAMADGLELNNCYFWQRWDQAGVTFVETGHNCVLSGEPRRVQDPETPEPGGCFAWVQTAGGLPTSTGYRCWDKQSNPTTFRWPEQELNPMTCGVLSVSGDPPHNTFALDGGGKVVCGEISPGHNRCGCQQPKATP